jgi:site-specific recombinase XerD
MTDTRRCAALDPAEAQRVWAAHRARVAWEDRQQHRVARNTIRKFLASFTPPTRPQGVVIDPPSVLRWLIEGARGKATGYVAAQLAVLDDFLGAQVRAGSLDSNPLAAYRDGYGSPSWLKVGQALQSDDPEQALAALRTPPRAPGPIDGHVRSYLCLQRDLGKKCRGHQTTLFDLDRFLLARAVSSPQEIDRDAIEQWLGSLSCGGCTRICKARLAQRFFDYLRCLSVVTDNPVPRTIRAPRSSFRPFIFTKEQVGALLDEAKKLPASASYRCRVPDTYFTMLALLSALGLRHGEVLRLRPGDLDLQRRALFIDQTKFHKSRYVPFGPKVGQCLERYLEARRAILRPAEPADPLFTANRRKAINPHTLRRTFRDILRRLGIAGAAGQPLPRLHDLRHSAARRIMPTRFSG